MQFLQSHDHQIVVRSDCPSSPSVQDRHSEIQALCSKAYPMESCTRLRWDCGHDLQYICGNCRIQEESLGWGDEALKRQIAQGKDIMSILCELILAFVWSSDLLMNDNFAQYVPICKPMRRIDCQKRNWLLRCRECCPLPVSQKLLSF